MICPTCKEEKDIISAGKYANVLSCNHVVTAVPVSDIIKQGANGSEAVSIAQATARVEELPKIDSKELIERALSSMSQTYEDFFTAENPLIDDMIKEHGKDNAILIFTAIHSHMSKVLFTMNRFRNFYFTRIEQMRKEIEDKAVKDLIQNHEFHYVPSDKKPKKVKTIGDKVLTKDKNQMHAAKEAMAGLKDKNGNPVDMMAVMSAMSWGKSNAEVAKETEKADYRAGLDKIKESLTTKKEGDKE